MRKLRSSIGEGTSGERPRTFRWLRLAVSTFAVLLLVFVASYVWVWDPGFWRRWENEDLPVVSAYNHSTHGGSRELQIAVDAEGKIFIGDRVCSLDCLGQLLRKGIADYGGNPDCLPVRIRADASVRYDRVLPVVQAVRAEGIVRICFIGAVIEEKAIATGLAVYLFYPSTNASIALRQDGDTWMVNGKVHTRDQVFDKMRRYGDADPLHPVVISCSPSNTVQDLVSLLDLCQACRFPNCYLLLPPPATNAVPGR
jgi:biopolymer transport protein ExbD